MNTAMPHKPSTAFIAASWVALLLGAAAYLIGLFNATMALNEKGYYLTLLLFGLFAAVSLQKSVRDRVEGIPVSGLYYALCWFALLSACWLACGMPRWHRARRASTAWRMHCRCSARWRCRRTPAT